MGAGGAWEGLGICYQVTPESKRGHDWALTATSSPHLRLFGHGAHTAHICVGMQVARVYLTLVQAKVVSGGGRTLLLGPSHDPPFDSGVTWDL